ncbi:MAG TPA: CoA transferase, partial [Terricaulis sp.]|nr:CoA transferase [Terricaulis sp.]
MRTLPLQGVRVLSIEQFGSAPYATMFLADMGAEVIKLEAGAGDFARQTGPKTLGEGDSLYFQCFNMNKKSVLLDIKDSDDYARFLELAATSDAVINNLRGHLPAARGLTYAALKGANPAIVCGHISAYGRDNTRQRRPGYDFLMQAEAGLMAVTGEPGAPPTRIGVSIIDYMTGMTMALGVMSAVHSASIDGVGRDVDVSLFDVAIHQLAYQGVWRLNGQDVTERAPRSAHSHTT